MNYNIGMVARGRFELPSGGPEPPMIAATPPGYMVTMLQESSVLINKSTQEFMRDLFPELSFSVTISI